jgi:hypothetical protein
MPLLRKGIILPAKGIDYSVPSTFIADQNSFSKNMYYYRGELRKRPGKVLVGEAISGGQIMGFGIFEGNTGIKYAIRASKTKIEKYNTSTLAWESISSSDLGGGDDDQINMAMVTEEQILAVTNWINVIRKWIGSGNTAALGGNPPKAKYAAYLSPYLLLAYTNDGISIKPWRVSWSDTGNCENWSSGAAGSLDLGDEPSVIQNILKLNEYAAVYKKDSIWLLNKVSSSDVFQKSCARTGIGLAASRAVIDADGQHYFMSFNDFHTWEGIRPTSIGAAVRDEVFRRIDPNRINRSFALHVQELSEVWFFIPVSGGSWPTEIWKYNYRLGFWYYDTCAELSAAMRWGKVASEAWNDDTPGSWNEALDVWDSGDSIANWEEIILGKVSGYCSKLDYTKADDEGLPVEGVFETKDFIGESLEKKTRWLQIDFWARGSSSAKLYIDYSVNGGDDWTNIPYTSSQAYAELTEKAVHYKFYFDIVSSEIRFRARNAETGEVFYIKAFYPYYLSKEQNRS